MREASKGKCREQRSAHLVERYTIFGVSFKQISDILDALTNTDSKISPVREAKNGKSQKFKNKAVEVSVNPDTGIIIQANPVHKKKRDTEI